MASSFAGHALFSSGPTRFVEGKSGEQVVSNAQLNPIDTGSFPSGPIEASVTVRGRLVASSDTALWTLRDAITAQLTNPPVIGTLIDEQGHSWATMSFVTFTPGDRTDRGRVISLAYEAKFVRFVT